MSLFPDVRHDDTYNQAFLEDKDDQFLQGFDYAFNAIIDLFADNLDVYEQELTELCPEGYEVEEDEAFATREDLYDIVENDKEILCAIIKDWLESERNSLVTSMIDGMDDETYEAIKNEAYKKNPLLKREFYNTLKYAITGKKEHSED